MNRDNRYASPDI